MTDQPSAQNWMWVLERPCPECGLDASRLDREALGDFIREKAKEWEERLVRPVVKARPRSDVWSTLEYACHVRDLLNLAAIRIDLMLSENSPTFENWDQDAAAGRNAYNDSDPKSVMDAIATASEKVAARFHYLTPELWERTGFRSDGVSFTLDTFGRHLIHEVVHHLHDVDRDFTDSES